MYRIPLIMSCENSNTINSPVVPAMDMAKELLNDSGVLSGSLFFTQPWLNSPDLGCSAVFFVKETAWEKADCIARNALTCVWDNRASFYPSMPNMEEALQRCRTLPRPICLVDYGDVPNAGSTGSGTFVLKALLAADLPFSSVVIQSDAEGARKAAKGSVGQSIDLMLGVSETPGSFDEKISIKGTILNITTDPFVHLGPAQKGYISHPGTRVLIQCKNVYIILCEHVCLSHDRNMLLTMGLAPDDIGIIAMRSTHTFISCYEGVMKSWLYVDTPGHSTRNLSTLDYSKCTRPIYPLDKFPDEYVPLPKK